METENYRLKKRMSYSLRRFIRGEMIDLNNITTNPIIRYIQLSRTDFRDYLEYQFIEGMTWENYGKEWVIDHIVPVRLFDMKQENDLIICWHFLNMMPMWKKDNKTKGESIEFAKLELQRRIEAAPSSNILQKLLDKVTLEERRANHYTYPLDFPRFYTKVNYTVQ